MPQGPLAEPLFTTIDTAAIAFYTGASALVATAITPAFQIFLTLYIVLWGFAHFRGMVTEPMGDFVTRVIKITFIYIFALKSGYYLGVTGDWIYQTPQRLLNIVAPAVTGALGAGDPANAIDLVLARGMDASQRFLAAGSSLKSWDIPGHLTIIFSAILIELFTLLIMGLALATILVAKVMLAVLLAVGPIFVALLLFDSTRSLFSAWMGQLLGAAFTYIIAGVVMLIGLAAIMVQLNAGIALMPTGTMPALSLLAGYIFVSIIILLVLLQVPTVGAALGNGVQVGTLGMSRTTWRALGSSLRASKTGLNRGYGRAISIRNGLSRNRVLRR